MAVEEILSNVGQYIALYAPIVVSILGSITTIIVSIKKIAHMKDDNKVSNDELRAQMQLLMNDNAELKQALLQEKNDKHKIYTRNHKRGE